MEGVLADMDSNPQRKLTAGMRLNVPCRDHTVHALLQLISAHTCTLINSSTLASYMMYEYLRTSSSSGGSYGVGGLRGEADAPFSSGPRLPLPS